MQDYELCNLPCACACACVCVCVETHKQGILPGSGATLVVPGCPSQGGHWKEEDGFLVRGECPQGKCHAQGTLGSVGAISAAQLGKLLNAPQKKVGMGDGGDAFSGKVAVAQGLPVGSAVVTGSTTK